MGCMKNNIILRLSQMFKVLYNHLTKCPMRCNLNLKNICKPGPMIADVDEPTDWVQNTVAVEKRMDNCVFALVQNP